MAHIFRMVDARNLTYEKAKNNKTIQLDALYKNEI